MSYICEFCCLRPENCGCSTELENPIVQRPYGLIDAPTPVDFFSLLVEMEKLEDYETPVTTKIILLDGLLNIPKLERQPNKLLEQDLENITDLIFDDDLSEFEIQPNHYCETCHYFICDCQRTQEDKDQLAREAYEMAGDCGTYDYDKFSRDFPDEEDPLVKCPTCEEMIYIDDQLGMCYSCFDIEQKLYPDDIPMELRYNN